MQKWAAKFGQMSAILTVLTVMSVFADDTNSGAPAENSLSTGAQHFWFRCKQPEKPAPADELAQAEPGVVNGIDTTPQMPLMQISDFAQTGGKGKFLLDTYAGPTRYFLQGSTATRIVTVANLGLCDNVDLSVTAQGVNVNNSDGTSARGMGDYNAFLKYQYYENEDKENHGKYAAFEVSLNGASQHSQDIGTGDPLTINIAHQFGAQLANLKNGPVMGNVTAQYTYSTNHDVTADNVAAAASLGFPLTEKIAMQIEAGVGRDVGAGSQGATQAIGSVGFLGKLTRCSKWMVMAQGIRDSIKGNQAQVYVGIRTSFDVKTHKCAL